MGLRGRGHRRRGGAATLHAVRAATGDLRLTGVSKTFGDVPAVDGLDLTVARGTFFALLGPSGCGKSTTLRMVAGLEQPTSGRVWLGGVDLTGTRAYERPVNTVFQSYALFPHLNVLDNVAFGPRRRRVADARARAQRALSLVQLDGYGARMPAELSGGQQQRVALARALVNEPEVLLLDEPLGALDLKLRRQMQVELRRLHRELGRTFVHVTHDQDEAMTIADQVALMDRGRIVQSGNPAELYDRPRSVFAANFLGKSNLVRATMRGSAGGLRLAEVAGAVLGVRPDRCVTRGPSVTLGVRPEKLQVHAFGGDAGAGPGDTAAGRTRVGEVRLPEFGDGTRPNVLGPGRIVHVAFAGVATEYLVALPGVGTWTVFAQNLSAHAPGRPGDQVMLSWDPRHTFGLDAAESLEHGTHDEHRDGHDAGHQDSDEDSQASHEESHEASHEDRRADEPAASVDGEPGPRAGGLRAAGSPAEPDPSRVTV